MPTMRARIRTRLATSAIPLAVALLIALTASAVDGLEVGTEQVWEYCSSRDLPRIAVINRMDRENADFERTLPESLDVANRLMVESFSGPDFGEGVRSFVERRAPNFAPLGGRPAEVAS